MPRCRSLGVCLLGVAVAAVPPGCSSRADGPDPLKVLFIGNSYTYMNDLPGMVAELARAGKQRPLEHDSETPGGCTLQQHATGGRAVEKITARKWDYVVLQEQSLRPIADPAAMLRHGKALDGEVKNQGAKTLLYLTWARQDAPDTQAALTKSYRELAAETKAGVAPVGVAWEAVLKDDPKAGLHDADRSHPSKKGTYLTACVFYGVLYRNSPEGLPGTPADLGDREAATLQRAAWKAVREFDGPK